MAPSSSKLTMRAASPKPLRLQLLPPAVINLGGLAAQRLLPALLDDVDLAAAVDAQVRGKAQQHELLLAAARRELGVFQQLPPQLRAHVVIEQGLDLPAAVELRLAPRGLLS